MSPPSQRMSYETRLYQLKAAQAKQPTGQDRLAELVEELAKAK